MRKTVNALGGAERAILSRSNGIINTLVILAPFTEKEEEFLATYGKVQVKVPSGRRVYVDMGSIYMYGKVDLTCKDDLDLIRHNNLVGVYDNCEAWLPDFDYETGHIILTDGIPKGAPTMNAVEHFKYRYTRIGRPERVIVYKIKKVQYV